MSISTSPSEISPSRRGIYIEIYSEKSFVVRGETRECKEDLRALGGKWNSNLREGGAWIYSNAKKNAVEAYIRGEGMPQAKIPAKIPVRVRAKPSTGDYATKEDIMRLERKLDRILAVLPAIKTKSTGFSCEEGDEMPRLLS